MMTIARTVEHVRFSKERQIAGMFYLVFQVVSLEDGAMLFSRDCVRHVNSYLHGFRAS